MSRRCRGISLPPSRPKAVTEGGEESSAPAGAGMRIPTTSVSTGLGMTENSVRALVGVCRDGRLYAL